MTNSTRLYLGYLRYKSIMHQIYQDCKPARFEFWCYRRGIVLNNNS